MCKVVEEAKKLFAKIREFDSPQQVAICSQLTILVMNEKEEKRADLQSKLAALDRELTPEERGEVTIVPPVTPHGSDRLTNFLVEAALESAR